jgi:hypothetical protein
MFLLCFTNNGKILDCWKKGVALRMIDGTNFVAKARRD